MKKKKGKLINNLITNAAVILVSATFLGCVSYFENMPINTERIEAARYYTVNNGTVVTESGFKGKYSADYLGDAMQCSDGRIMFNGIKHKLENNVPVWVKIADKATPNDFSDDEIIMVGLDFCAYMDEVIKANDAYIAELQAKYAK